MVCKKYAISLIILKKVSGKRLTNYWHAGAQKYNNSEKP